MKLTLDIPNEHAPRLLALLADLMPVRLEPQADPAEGHPELPLDDESEAIAETRWAPVATAAEAQAGTEVTRPFTPASLRFAASGIDAADPLKVEMEPAAPVRDGDAELPFPEGFPELPPLPEGKTRWGYRGTFSGVCPSSALKCIGRHIEYWDADQWCKTDNFSTFFHHIEAL